MCIVNVCVGLCVMLQYHTIRCTLTRGIRNRKGSIDVLHCRTPLATSTLLTSHSVFGRKATAWWGPPHENVAPWNRNGAVSSTYSIVSIALSPWGKGERDTIRYNVDQLKTRTEIICTWVAADQSTCAAQLNINSLTVAIRRQGENTTLILSTH